MLQKRHVRLDAATISEGLVCVNAHGLSLHAGMRCGADEARGAEAPVPAMSPARQFSNERRKCNQALEHEHSAVFVC